MKKKFRVDYFKTKDPQDLANLVEDSQIMINYFMKKYNINKNKKDYIQHMNILLMQSIQRFDPSYGTKFTTYLYRLLTMGMWTKFKQNKRKLPTVNNSKIIAVHKEDPSKRIQRKELLDAIYNVLGKDSDSTKVIVEHFLLKKSYKEIGEEMGITRKRASFLTQKGFKKLREAEVLQNML